MNDGSEAGRRNNATPAVPVVSLDDIGKPERRLIVVGGRDFRPGTGRQDRDEETER